MMRKPRRSLAFLLVGSLIAGLAPATFAQTAVGVGTNSSVGAVSGPNGAGVGVGNSVGVGVTAGGIAVGVGSATGVGIATPWGTALAVGTDTGVAAASSSCCDSECFDDAC